GAQNAASRAAAKPAEETALDRASARNPLVGYRLADLPLPEQWHGHRVRDIRWSAADASW
ncbi:MAG TPA: hypothetical protein VI138_00230, partial [Candidatus Dormibacteraeota bacterium]